MKWWLALVLLSVLLWPIAVDPAQHKFYLNYYIKTCVICFLIVQADRYAKEV